MKKIVCFWVIVSLILSLPAMAADVTFTVTISEEELKALEWNIYNVQEWIQNAISNKARRCVDSIVEEHSDKQARKLTVEQRWAIVKNADIESAKTRTDRMEAEAMPR